MGKKEPGEKLVTEVKTFPVPFPLGDIKEKIPLKTNTNSQLSKEDIINQAISFHSQGNISEAIKYYKQFIEQGFNNHIVFSNYGVILKDLGRLEEAELYHRKAINLRPDFADGYSNLGNTLKDLGKLKEAEMVTRKAIEFNPNFANALCNLGNILKDLGQLEEAEKVTRKAIKLLPNFGIAFCNLGNILKDIGKLKEAEKATRKAIKLLPNFAEAYSNLGGILKDLGELTEAEISTKKAIELKPSFAKAHFNLSSILQSFGKREEAIKHLIIAVEIKPEREDFIKALALSLIYENKYELALKYLSKNNSDNCQSLYLGCLLSLDREEAFNRKYKDLYEKKVCNADIGGIIEHANIIYKKEYYSTFCNQSIKYILWDKIDQELFSEDSLTQLISYIKSDKATIRSQDTLKGGLQTSGNLFALDYPFIKSIKKALEDKIELYKNKFKDSNQGFINNWPSHYQLRSWMISMKTGGFLKPHNHEYGWITGSFYLQVPKVSLHNEEGSIAFSYQGPRYPRKDKNFNLIIKKVEVRDICIFPSSLFHHTIPFESNKERICFVFDLVQKK